MLIKTVCIIIPIFNEQKYLRGLLDSLLKEVKNLRVIKRIYIIDDGSSDNTPKIISSYKSKYHCISSIAHKKNLGKGSAMNTGFKKAIIGKPDCVIFMDGDRQHDPKYLIKFIEEIASHPIVFGYRNLSKNAPTFRKYGNKIAGILIKNLFHIKRRDLLCGFMALRRDALKRITWKSKGYGVEAEITIMVALKNINYGEVFIPTIYLDNKKGANIVHALRILLKLPRWYFFPTRY